MATLQLISDFAGKTIGNYYVEEKIGEGGFGLVYRARHLTLDDRVVAIKLLKPELHDPALIERFRNEARAAARVKHPGIVRIDDIGEHRETGAYYIIMEYLRGKDLAQWLAPHKEGLPLAEVLALLYDVADALDAVHDMGIIHRDLKPENLFRQEDGLVKILDLGIAKLSPDLAGSFRTATNIVLGSPGYFAPELADPKQKAPIDRRSDVFSLSAVAYKLITHERAWHFNDPWHYIALVQQADEKRPRDLRLLRPEAPAGWSRTVMAGLAKNPDSRPPTAGALVRALAASFPNGEEIVAQRADAIRAARGMPPAPRASTAPQSASGEQRSRTPILNAPAGGVARSSASPAEAPDDRAIVTSASPPVAPSAASVPTLRVQAPSSSENASDEHDPSRIPTLVPSRIPTLTPESVPAMEPALSPDRVPTLVGGTRVPSGAIPELLGEPDAAPDTRPIKATPSKLPDRPRLDEARPVSMVASGTVAANATAAPAGHVEHGGVVLDPSLAGPTVTPAKAMPASATPIGMEQSPRWRPIAGVTLALATVVAAVVLVRSLTRSDGAATSANPTDAGTVALATPTDAAALALESLIDATPSALAASPDAAPILDAATESATLVPDAAPARPREGKLEVYANQLTDVFLVSGSRTKFLGTTPLPARAVPAGTLTLELRSQGRKTTRKVTVRSGRRARVDYTWPN